MAYAFINETFILLETVDILHYGGALFVGPQMIGLLQDCMCI
jgi:hypothetical protein